MADYTLTMADSDYSVTAVDQNTKVALDGSDLAVDLWEDEFGTSLDSHWTEGALFGTEGGSINETGNVLVFSVAGAAGAWRYKHVWSDAVFDDGVWETEFTNIGWVESAFELVVHVDSSHWIFIDLYLATGSPTKQIRGYYDTGGGATHIATQNLGSAPTTCGLRLTRSGNSWDLEYNIDGGGWSTLASGQTAAIGSSCRAGACVASYGNGNTSSCYATYFRISGSGYYWDDSPEATLVESGQTYAFDAGAGLIWQLTGGSSTEDGDGGSVKYKGGYSDDGSTVTWVDGSWQTIAQINTNAAAGNYDGHRYLHFKAQFNSDGSQAPNITDFTISGATATGTTITQSDTQAYESTYSAKVVGFAGSQVDNYVAHEITTNPGEDYYVEAWVYCTGAPTAGYFYLQAYDVDNTTEIDIAKVTTTTSGWRKIGFYFQAPASCGQVSIRVGGNAQGGTCYFDGADCIRLRAKDYT